VVTVAAALCGKQENQFQPGLCRTSRRHQASSRRYLAGQFYGVRFRLLRLGDQNLGASRKSIRSKSVTHVTGTFCNPLCPGCTVVIWSALADESQSRWTVPNRPLLENPEKWVPSVRFTSAAWEIAFLCGAFAVPGD
jgi:hypothetical protein